LTAALAAAAVAVAADVAVAAAVIAAAAFVMVLLPNPGKLVASGSNDKTVRVVDVGGLTEMVRCSSSGCFVVVAIDINVVAVEDAVSLGY
jgi:hypothetical protein